MQVTSHGFIVASQYEWESKPRFTWYPFEPTLDDDSVVVKPHSITFEVPDDFDMRPHRIQQLEKRKDELREKVAVEVEKIDQEIQSLLAITNEG